MTEIAVPRSAAGIIANTELTAELKQGRLIAHADMNRVQSCSYDMRVGTIFRNGQVITAAHPKANEQVIIRPGEVISIFTLEEMLLPDDVAATAFPMNSLSSQGLLVLNPGHIDPGFRGPLTVRALNLRKVDLALSRGEPIFTVILERLEHPAKPSYNSRNKTREDREREFNKTDVETSMRSLSGLVALDAPFPTHKEVNELIRDHWLSRLTFAIAVIGMIGAIVAAFAAVVAVIQNFNSSTERQVTTVEHKAKPTPEARPTQGARPTQEAIPAPDDKSKGASVK